MKKQFNRLLSITLFSCMLVFFAGNRAQAQDVSVSYQTFYDELSPYGQWVNDAQYGNVWVPNEGGDFRPYGSRGHWVMTEYGNTWVSDDPWGWACYHYGRWTYNSYYGWIWVPGYEWAPAWVSWRYGGGYSGWAPLAPGYAVGASYGCPDSWWVFVAPQYMYHDNCISYWRGPSYNHEYFGRAHFIENVYQDNGTHVRYNYGPRAEAIQQVTHQPVQVYRISQTNRPGAPNIRQNTVSMYRPSVNRNTVSSARPSNVIQAPRSIGKPQAAAEMSGARTPAFRQEVQKNNPAPAAPRTNGNTGIVGPRGNQPAQNNNNAGRGNNTHAPGRQNTPQQAQPQQQNRPQAQPQQARPQAQPQQPRSQAQPQQARPQMQQPQQRPQPQPQQQNRPEPQHFNQQPQQQQRSQPMQQSRPEPMQQAPRPQPMPQARPQAAPRPAEGGGGHEGGGREGGGHR